MTDYFALLGLPRRFAVDPGELERRYLELSRQVHPDRAGERPPEERASSAGQAMTVNQAYRVLRRELPRAEHLFALAGGTIGDNEPVSPALLGEMLELREELDEARRLDDRAALDRLEREARRRERSELDGLAQLFAALEAGGGDRAEQLARVKQQLIALRYLARYREAFEDAEDAA